MARNARLGHSVCVAERCLERLRFPLFGFSMLMAALPALASELSFQADNDIVYGTDRQYTGGVNVRWTNENGIGLVNWLIDPIEKAALPKKGERRFQKTDQLELSTQIFTLEKRTDSGLESAGNTAWTHFDWRRFYHYGRHQSLLSFSVGWLGPASGGREIQDGIHSVIGNSNASGWDNQLPDQPTLQIGFDNQYFLFDPQLEPHFQMYRSLSIMVGSPETALNAGVGAYYGDGARPVMSFNTFNHVMNTGKGFGWFVFADISAQYQIYNVLRDGRLFTKDDTGLKPANEVIPSGQYGGAMTWNGFYVLFAGSVFGQFYRDQPEEAFRFASLVVGFEL